MKVFVFLVSLLSFSNAQQLVGSQRDEPNCVSDGGYSWCDSTQSCIRPWMTPCPEITVDTPVNRETMFCPRSKLQMCRMMCSPPKCSENKCAMRKGFCCDYTCHKHIDSSAHRRLNEDELKKKTLKEGNICLRFCEDNSESFVNKRYECSNGMECLSPVSDRIGFDICGANAYTCQKLEYK